MAIGFLHVTDADRSRYRPTVLCPAKSGLFPARSKGSTNAMPHAPLRAWSCSLSIFGTVDKFVVKHNIGSHFAPVSVCRFHALCVIYIRRRIHAQYSPFRLHTYIYSAHPTLHVHSRAECLPRQPALKRTAVRCGRDRRDEHRMYI
jgi:hypothetical protein